MAQPPDKKDTVIINKEVKDNIDEKYATCVQPLLRVSLSISIFYINKSVI